MTITDSNPYFKLILNLTKNSALIVYFSGFDESWLQENEYENIHQELY